MQLPFPSMMPESDWRMPNEFPDLVGRGAKYVGLDTETCDPHLMEKGPGFIRGDAFVAGYSVYADGFNAYYPIRHATGSNLPPNLVNEWLAEQLRTDVPKYVANGLYDLEGAYSEGITDIRGRILDIQVAEPLIDEETAEGYSLEILSRKYLGKGKEETILKEAAQLYSHGGKRRGRGNIQFHEKRDLWLMDPKYVGPYAQTDSLETVLVMDKQLKILEDDGLMPIFELESDLIPILLRMRIAGIRVDVEAAEKLAKEMTLEIDQLSTEIWKLVGFDLNIDSGPQLGKAYDQLNAGLVNKISFKYTAINNRSFDKEWLSLQEDPLSAKISKKRKLMTLRDDFVVGDILGEQINGRVHAQFHQLRQQDRGTRTGRFSSSNPNLQQIPKRDKIWGPRIRSLFIANEGDRFLKVDVHQQEPRLLVHFASLCNLPGAAEAVAVFRENPLTDYHVLTMEICNRNSGRNFVRDELKSLNLGKMYGMGLDKLCRQLNVSQQVGRMIIAEYDAAIPFVKALSNKCMTVAQDRGFIRTILGRLRRFNLFEPVAESKEERKYVAKGLPREYAEAKWPGRRLQRWGTHKALNALIQGSAADQIKQAMRTLFYSFGIVPSLQVHDELCGSVSCIDQARTYKRVVQDAVTLEIPVIADAKLGRSWGEGIEEVTLAAAA